MSVSESAGDILGTEPFSRWMAPHRGCWGPTQLREITKSSKRIVKIENKKETNLKS